VAEPDRYSREKVIRQCGLGCLSEARLASLGRSVLLLEVQCPPGLPAVDGRELLERFLAAGRTLSRGAAGGIIPPCDAGALSDRSAFLAFQRPETDNLRPLPDPPGRRDWTDAVRLALDLARLLETAGETGLPLVRFCPADVWLTQDGWARLLPADLSWLTQEVGLPAALGGIEPDLDAPEAQAADAIEPQRALVYSLAAWIYRTIASSPSPAALIRAGRTVEPLWCTVPGVPGVLDDAIRKALAIDPNDRFESMAQFRRALEAAVPWMPVTSAANPPSSSDRQSTVLAGAGWHYFFPLLCVTLIAAAGGYLLARLIP